MNNKKINSHLFPYEWNLKDDYPAKGIKKHNKKVFSCFACGGGSTMGYKLAGYDVIGCNEIDPKMMAVYKTNLKPQYSYLEPIQTFKIRNNLPQELYNLDILDGSPPCSSFSIAGNREKDWGKKKKFREGQTKQILDTLFFDFIDLTKKLQPKVVIAENVKGIIMGNAIKYSREIIKQFDNAGYYTQHWLLDASKMGVPQRRERVFFIGLRKDLAKQFMYQKTLFEQMPLLELIFNEEKILFKQIDNFNNDIRKKIISKVELKYIYNKTASGVWQTEKKSLNGKIGAVGFGYSVVNDQTPLTITASGSIAYKDGLHYISNNETKKIGTFPIDYNFLKNKVQYIIGMSVPPVMIAQISNEIYNQWLSKII